MKPKRIISFLLAICLVAGLMPTVAFATGSDKVIMRGTKHLQGGQADNIYFGTYQQSSDGSGGYNTDPIKWRVLSNSDGKLFLLSDQNLDVKPYNSSYTSITWEKSTIRSWLNGYEASKNNSGTDYSSNNFIDAAFSSGEQGAIAETYVYNATQSDGSSNPNPSYNTSGGENTTDKVFLLSIEEANNSGYFPNGDSSRISTNTAYVASYRYMSGVGEADFWWLRSPGFYDFAAYVRDGGGVDHNGDVVDSTFSAVRPAFNLNLNSVLFTSAAVGGKSATGMDSGLTAVNGYTGSEWKLTLLDSSRNFSVTETTAEVKSGGTITLNYTGATAYDAGTAPNEYISAMIVDSSGVQYYGRIAQPTSADGQVQITIPAALTDGIYTLNVFSEQYNGDKRTDYASAFKAVALTVSSDTAPTLSNGSATRDSETTATVKFTSDEAGSYYYVVNDSIAAPDSIDTSGEGASCNANEETTITLDSLSGEYIHIVVKDADNNVSDILTIQIPAYTFTVSDKAIMLGASNISGYDNTNGYDYIYYGTWSSSPIKWRVLDDQTNFDSDSDGTNDAGLFLLSDGLLGTGNYGDVYFDNTSPYSNAWQGSDAQAWCNTFASSNLDSRELAAILETTKSDEAFISSTYSLPFAASENILNGDKVFFLSAEEAETSGYGFGSDDDRKANYRSSAGDWWLRSPNARNADRAGFVLLNGRVNSSSVDIDWAARPAFNLRQHRIIADEDRRRTVAEQKSHSTSAYPLL